ncbi:unnamed protein product [Schistocephalus solidus]|uniref:Vps16_C domain-containing protein n=1 Tax=Schistocephalus solidus TaxID=70667 RepID=A0A183T6K3_SCHSO|nr:unnamed protein product [Schistocephalus solidus]
MRQESNECIGDFIMNLTLAIQYCRYEEIKAGKFKQAMLVGLRDEKAREYLLAEKRDLMWEKACDIASHQERVRQNLQQINQSKAWVISFFEPELAVSLVNTAGTSYKQQSSVPPCYRTTSMVRL